MTKLNDIIKKGEYKSEGLRRRVFNWQMDAQDFIDELLEYVKQYSFDGTYIIDQNNQNLLHQLYYFLSESDQFKGNLFKGMLFIGRIGCGKTLLMEGFLRCFEVGSNKVVTRIHAKDLNKSFLDKGIEYYYQRPLFIDDIGKEPTEAKDYGNDSKPFEDLISSRYRYRGVMFGTSNLKLEDMPYSQHTIDRLKEMFNIIIMPGDSRRA